MTEQRRYGRPVVDTRVAVRRALRELQRSDPSTPGAQAGTPATPVTAQPLVLVALSGGADSLALALAAAYEAPRSRVRAGAVIVDHGLQEGSAGIAEAAAEQARQMGLAPVLVERVSVGSGVDHGGPEAAARTARYAAFARAADRVGACAVLTAHTRDDQAEQVLLALARGSGLRSLAGIPVRRTLGTGTGTGTETGTGSVASTVVRGDHGVSTDTVMLRPFLADDPAITRAVTEAACVDQGAEFWRDPHNADPRYARVRARARVLPVLEAELGPGVAAALARTADLAREDADALDAIAADRARQILEQQTEQSEHIFAQSSAQTSAQTSAGETPVSVPVEALAGELPAIRNRVIREIAKQRFGAQLDRGHTLAVAALVTNWRGQSAVYVPGIAVTREAGVLRFTRQVGSPRA